MLTMLLELEYDNIAVAEAVYSAIVPDDDGYVSTHIEGSKVVFEFKAENAGQMRSAINDVLACVKISESTSAVVAVSAPDLDGDPFLQ